MLNLKQTLAADVGAGIEAAREAGDLAFDGDVPDVVVDVSESSEHGDYASPVALRLAPLAQAKPMDIVEVIAKHMPKKEYVGRIKGVAPGYLNIWLNTGWMTARLDNLIEQDLCGDVNTGEGKSVNLEFISANPTGPLTLGNIRTAFSVDALATVLECAGYAVTREYYVNDFGGQIRRLGESLLRRILQSQSPAANVEYPDELYQGEYVRDVAATLAEQWRENEGKEFSTADLKDDEMIDRLGGQGADLILEGIKKMIAEDLHITFDVWTSERTLRKSGAVAAILKKLQEKNYTYSKDGAEHLKTSEFGDSQDQVLVKSDGELTYFVPDIAYHVDKYDRKYDVIFTFVGADHAGHVGRMKAAMEMLGQDPSKLLFVSAQWMGIVRDGKPVKMSKRRGELYSPQDLISEIGYDAARFFMIQHQLTTHMDLDIDLAQERSERNPVYYVQYAYVRLQSILRQAKERGVIDEVGVVFDLSDSPVLTHTLELRLMRQLYRFPEVISGIAETFEVHSLPYYASDVAKAVHVFYRHVPVLASDDAELVRSRLQLVLAAQRVLGQVLELMGVSKPDVM